MMGCVRVGVLELGFRIMGLGQVFFFFFGVCVCVCVCVCCAAEGGGGVGVQFRAKGLELFRVFDVGFRTQGLEWLAI